MPITTTSTKPSILYTTNKLPIVDFPGHPRCRSQLSNYLKSAMKIVFVLDSSNMTNQIRDAAEFLYDLFTDPLIDKCSKLYVVCNKSDLPGARPPARVKLLLQQELEKIKTTRKSLDDADDSNFVPLGRTDQPFNIDQDSPITITFGSFSAKTQSMDLITNFLEF
jgi:signal recognition particle receptor subunit beta